MRLEATSRRPTWPLWAVGVAALWAGVMGVGVWLAQTQEREIILCVFKRLTGLPCPTCGSSRSVIHLFNGRVLEAFQMQPFMFIAGIMVIASLLLRVAFARRINFGLTARQRRLAGWGVIGLLLANWIYVILYVG
jgi:hypothetical protein